MVRRLLSALAQTCGMIAAYLWFSLQSNWKPIGVALLMLYFYIMGALTHPDLAVDRPASVAPVQVAAQRMAPEPFDCTSVNTKVDAGDRLEQRRFANDWQELYDTTVRVDGYDAQFDIPAPSGSKYRNMRVVFNTVKCEYSLQVAHFSYEHGYPFGHTTYANATAALLKSGIYHADFTKYSGEYNPTAAPCTTSDAPNLSIKRGWPNVSFSCKG